MHYLVREFPEYVSTDERGDPILSDNMDGREEAIQRAVTIAAETPSTNELGQSVKAFWTGCASVLCDPNPYAELHAKCLALRSIGSTQR